jgi:hypothetical protein
MDDALVDFRARLDGIDPTLRERYRGREVRSRAVVGVSRRLPVLSSLVKKSVSEYSL